MTKPNNDDDLLAELHDISVQFNATMKEMENEQEVFWESLTKEQQLQVFCCVARRIYDGEIKQRGSYRYVLYDVFGWGPEAYVAAQDAGYLSIHNTLFDGQETKHILKSFCKKYNIDDADRKIEEFDW